MSCTVTPRFDALDLAGYDLVISSKYPAWMIRHPRHVVYMAHPLRGLYDTYAGPLAVPSGGTLEPRRVRSSTLLRIEAPGLRSGTSERCFTSALAMVDRLPADHPDLAFPGPLARMLVRWLDRDALDPVNTSAHLAISRTVARRDGYFPDRSQRRGRDSTVQHGGTGVRRRPPSLHGQPPRPARSGSTC